MIEQFDVVSFVIIQMLFLIAVNLVQKRPKDPRLSARGDELLEPTGQLEDQSRFNQKTAAITLYYQKILKAALLAPRI